MSIHCASFPGSGLQSVVFTDPPASVLVLQNIEIKGRTLFFEWPHDKLEILPPTMYQSWGSLDTPKVKLKSDLRRRARPRRRLSNKTVFIFDTWGVSSYYHLLIDHIIPLWLTRYFLERERFVQGEDVVYFRVSKNGWRNELTRIQEIFEYFLGSRFSDAAAGHYPSAVVGYLYSWRPYRGPNETGIMSPDYHRGLSEFRRRFSVPVPNPSQILVPIRNDRNFAFVERFVTRFSSVLNFRRVDFSAMTIDEQIEAAGNARAMFGAEGAAFANQVFMPPGGVVVAVSSNEKRFEFHRPVAHYSGHRWHEVLLNSDGQTELSETEILAWLTQRREDQGVSPA